MTIYVRLKDGNEKMIENVVIFDLYTEGIYKGELRYITEDKRKEIHKVSRIENVYNIYVEK